jgi:hypothetical protein
MSSREVLRIFLSASVPLPSRDPIYFRTGDPIAIRDAVRALTMVVVERGAELVFGGHPAITPMIRLQIAQAGRNVGDLFVLFQSRFFQTVLPLDNSAFPRVHLVNEISGDPEASLERLRIVMLSGRFDGSFFIGRMDNVEKEYTMFQRMHKGVPAFPVASTGAAAKRLFDADTVMKRDHPELRDEISYLTLMRNLVSLL